MIGGKLLTSIESLRSCLLPLSRFVVIFIAQVSIHSLGLSLAPSFGEHRIILSFVSIPQECLSRVFISHITERDSFFDMFFARL